MLELKKKITEFISRLDIAKQRTLDLHMNQQKCLKLKCKQKKKKKRKKETQKQPRKEHSRNIGQFLKV